MAQRVQDINPDCRVEAHTAYYLPDQPQDFLSGCDFAADCIDMVSAKLALAQECRDRAIPLISAMGCGNKLDPTRFKVAPIEKTSVCPLCRVMRRELSRRGIAGVTVVYSDEPPVRAGSRKTAAGRYRRDLRLSVDGGTAAGRGDHPPADRRLKEKDGIAMPVFCRPSRAAVCR